MLVRAQWLGAGAVIGSLLSLTPPSAGQETVKIEKRPVTVADSIEMTRIGEPFYVGNTGVGPKSGFAAFSEDGSRFVVVVHKGNLKENTDDYSLLLFETANVTHGVIPKKLTTFSSSSNHQGISDVSWLDKNTILFLGSRGTEPAQLYSIECKSRHLRKLTSHKTSLISYAASKKTERVVYLAEPARQEVVNQDVLRRGLHITSQELPDLLTGKITAYEPELFTTSTGAVGENRLQTQGSLDSGYADLFLSPDGRYLILKAVAQELNATWRQYDDEMIRTAFRREIPKGSPSGVLRYEVVDIQSGKSDVLLDTPAPFSSADVMWSPSSNSVVLCGAYLPLDVSDATELHARQSSRFIVELDLPSPRLTKIASGDLRPVQWNQRTNVVQFYSRQYEGHRDNSSAVYFQKSARGWERLLNAPTARDERPDIRIDEDLNTPPRIIAVDAVTGQQNSLLDLNPQFARLRFAHVEAIQWVDGAGKPVSGGLYLPLDYQPGQSYPLVIQTHGFDPKGFWIDGPWSTAFAAQALAGRGIVVLQVNDSFPDSRDTPEEAARVMTVYENAITYLLEKGIIDGSRIGLIGFSRSCLYVKYALTHSNQHFAAAVASDGFDGGYLEYIVAFPLAESEIESVIGAAPLGAGLAVWLKNSPGFLLDRMHTPIQLQANAPASLFEQWEWFSGLKRLNRPVDLLYLPAGDHILMRPWDRMVSQQGSVDWLCFWLKGEEDPAPEKAGQYARWRELREQQPALTQQN